MNTLHHLIADQEDYPWHSRVHRLKCGAYIKREDELGCIISGSKIRKFRSLVREIKRKGYKKVGLIGSQQSNHVLGLSSLLIENGIEPTLFLLEAGSELVTGNALFTQLFVPKSRIHFVKRDKWPNVMEQARAWQASHDHAYVVPEGGAIAESVPGLITLALDILQNEKESKVTFKDILVDSGTGLTAASLIAAFGLLKKEANIHVMLAAPVAFREVLDMTQQTLENLTGEKITELPKYTLHTPPTARSFGATNATIFQAIKEAARTEGVLLDPIYSSKLYLLLQTLAPPGPTLFIHSGGLFSLMGFQAKL